MPRVRSQLPRSTIPQLPSFVSLRALRGERRSLCVLCVLCGGNLARSAHDLAGVRKAEWMEAEGSCCFCTIAVLYSLFAIRHSFCYRLGQLEE